MLNLLIGFLSPKIDPDIDSSDDGVSMLPTKSDDEYRPFIRRLPEFKFWYDYFAFPPIPLPSCLFSPKDSCNNGAP